jgi:tetratricopeptide (TPR) repeat protein
VQRYLVSHPVVDALYRRLPIDPVPYPTFRDALANHFYGFSYAYIVDRLVSPTDDEDAIVTRLAQYAHENLFAPQKYAIIDAPPLSSLQRGIGWCDQRAHLLVELLDRRRIPGRLLFLRRPQGDSAHSVASVYLDGRWGIVDPLYLLLPRSPSGGLAAPEEICRDTAEFGVLAPEAMGLAGYREQFCQEPRTFLGNESAQPDALAARQQGVALRRKTRVDAWRTVLDLPGPIGADLFIALYVQAIRDCCATADEYAYTVARVYHILLKYPAARRWYARVLTNTPESPRREESLFFLGLAAYQQGRYRDVGPVYDRLWAEFPRSPWAGYAHLIAGKALLALGRPAQAKEQLETVLRVSPGEESQDARRLLQALALGQPDRALH